MQKLTRFLIPMPMHRKPEIRILPQWERLANLGLNTEDIGDTIQTAIQGTIPTQIAARRSLNRYSSTIRRRFLASALLNFRKFPYLPTIIARFV